MDNTPEQQPAGASYQVIEPPVIAAMPASATSLQKSNRPARVIWLIVTVVLCGLISFGGAWLAVSLSGKMNPSGDLSPAIITADEELVAKVADTVAPSVVSIVTTTRTMAYGYAGEAQSAGTGVIVSTDGYIMTNKHVVEDARDVEVVAADGTQYAKVSVVGSDPLNDIAFLKISGAKDLPAATLGDSGTVRIGQRVVAIGNALGQFNNTVTSGIISATGRPLVASSADGQSSEQLSDLIQTDAAINGGNSGGPLVDMSGRVIGINTAVAQDANGIGFAIPINATKGVLESVLSTGKVTRAYMGVRYVDITPEVATSKDLSVRSGAYVSGNGAIVPGSPADKAGLRSGDIITKIDQYEIGKNGSMSSITGQYRPGDTVTLTILRSGKEIMQKLILSQY